MELPKFQMFDEVYFENVRFWITGVNLKCGYDLVLWEYSIGKMLYDDAKPFAYGDKLTREHIRDEQLLTSTEYKAKLTKQLADDIAQKQQELNKLLDQQKESE